MDYVLFLGTERIGTMYPNFESAKSQISGNGIWNICGVKAIDGKLKIVSRESILIKNQ